LNKTTSLYLDFLRVIAALGVLLVHASLPSVSRNILVEEDVAHHLVMIFFVLSGFLIAYSASSKSKNLKSYSVDRFSRLYSVVIPALIFTYAIDAIGTFINPDFYTGKIEPNSQPLRFLMNFLFIQQIWNFCIKPSTNGVFWSISYEFWYYFLFGIFFYLRGYKRLILLAVFAFLIGLKILLLAPVWILGVICFYYSKYRINRVAGIIIFTLTLCSIIYLTFFYNYGLANKGLGSPPFFFSALFIYDWLFGLLVAVNIFSFNSIEIADSFYNKIPSVILNSIKYLSSITFTLYMFHLPLLLFLAAIVPYNKESYTHLGLLILLLLFVIAAIAAFTEKRRTWYKTKIESVFSFFERTFKSI